MRVALFAGYFYGPPQASLEHLILAGRLPKNWPSFKELRSHRPENAKIDVKTDGDVSL